MVKILKIWEGYYGTSFLTMLIEIPEGITADNWEWDGWDKIADACNTPHVLKRLVCIDVYGKIDTWDIIEAFEKGKCELDGDEGCMTISIEDIKFLEPL